MKRLLLLLLLPSSVLATDVRVINSTNNPVNVSGSLSTVLPSSFSVSGSTINAILSGTPLSAIDSDLGIINANLTNGNAQTSVTNFPNITIKPLSTQITGSDLGSVTNSVIHGLTTAGGGSYVDVKVNPSGALAVDGSGTTQPVSGTVNVSNFVAPSTHTSVDNFPTTQAVSGNVVVTNFVAPSSHTFIDNIPALSSVAVTNFPVDNVFITSTTVTTSTVTFTFNLYVFTLKHFVLTKATLQAYDTVNLSTGTKNYGTGTLVTGFTTVYPYQFIGQGVSYLNLVFNPPLTFPNDIIYWLITPKNNSSITWIGYFEGYTL